jgi:hypothetical protein
MNAAKSVTATFTLKTYAVTASAGTGGSISPIGAVSVNYGANQSFTITANAGYSIANVLVDGTSIGAVTSYTFSNITAAHTISASFSAILQTTIAANPPDPSTSSSSSFSFTSTYPSATFECRMDGGVYSPCTSPKVYAGLSDGSHTFEVRAMDAAGNVDSTPAGYTWTVDTGALSGITEQTTSGNHLNSAVAAGILIWDHTVIPGADKILIVTTALDSNAGATITDVSYNGSSLTRKTLNNVGFKEEVQLWYMLEPPVGSYQLAVSYSNKHSGLEARASTYTGVNQFRPFSNVTTAGGSGAYATVAVASNSGELVIDGLAYRSGGMMASAADQVEIYKQRDNLNTHGASEKAGASPNVTMSWTLQNSSTWSMVAASLMPVGSASVRTVSVRPSCAGVTDCYTSLNEAIAGEAFYGSLVSRNIQLDIELYNMEDTRKVDLRPFDGLTDAIHYIRIYTPQSERHQGVWDDLKYHMNISATILSGQYPECILIGNAYVWLDGIQLNCSASCSAFSYPSLISVNPGTRVSTLKVSNSILKATFTGASRTNTVGISTWTWPANSEGHLWNNVIYDLSCSTGRTGVMLSNRLSGKGDWYVYNTTLYNSAKALSISGAKVHVRNSIANGLTTSGWTGCASDSDYNITNLNETITGSHSKKNTTVNFVNVAGRVFVPSTTDSAARNSGQNLLNSPSVNEGADIANNPRDAIWDIGALESAE